jgi:hypothetical protein
LLLLLLSLWLWLLLLPLSPYTMGIDGLFTLNSTTDSNSIDITYRAIPLIL